MEQQQPPKASKQKARRKLDQVIMDNNQIMILGNIYQTWLKDASSLVSKRRKVNSNFDFIRSTKISDLMDMPLVALMSYLDKSSSELYYLSHLCSSGRNAVQSTVQKLHPQPSSSHEKQPRNSTPHEFPPQTEGEYEMETGPHPMDFTDGIEKLRGNVSAEYDRAYNTLHSDHSVTQGSPGLSRRSGSSAGGSGQGFIPLDPEVQLPSSGSGTERTWLFKECFHDLNRSSFCICLSKRRQHSSGRSLGNLDPVDEDFPLEQEVRDFKMRRLSDLGQLLVDLLFWKKPNRLKPHVRSALILSTRSQNQSSRK
ncbi:hypothetical protein SEVIR_6G051350v4 [Setaria viridis]